MTDFLDGLAKDLARPMSRSRALRVVGATIVGVGTGSFTRTARAGLGRRQHICDTRVQKEGWRYCTSASERCFPTCCPRGWQCCKGECGSNGCCEMFCCNPCNPLTSRCVGRGVCGRGPVNPDCCGGELRPGSSPCGNECCQPDEFCAFPRLGRCCKRGERVCGSTCCKPNEECKTLRFGTASISTCERRCPPGQAWCGRNKCCPRRWRCANERTGLCKRCQMNEEECGTKCCNKRTHYCGNANLNLCCPNNSSACPTGYPGPGRTCCARPNKCARQLPATSGGITQASPYVCCPPERQVPGATVVCCAPGQVSLGGRLIVGPGIQGLCCNRSQLCGSGAGLTCCQRSEILGNATCCGGRCVDTRFDPSNCGRCGQTCAANQRCQGGACIAA
jgi:hypothetical protein